MANIPLPQVTSLPDVFFNRLGQTQTAQTNMLNNVLAGIKNKMAQQQLAVNPQMLQAGLQSSQLSNLTAEEKLKYLPQLLSSQALRQSALANLAQAQASSPLAKYGIKGLVGPAAQAMSLQALAAMSPGSNAAQQAQSLFQATIDEKNARAKFMGSNTQFKNLPKVAKDQLQNQFQAENAARQQSGMAPLTLDDWWAAQQGQMKASAINEQGQANQITGMQNNISNPSPQGSIVAPGEQINTQPDVKAENQAEQVSGTQNQGIKLLTQPDYWKEANQTSLNLIKETTDADARKRLRFAANVDATIGRVNQFAKDAFSYSHPGGLVELAADKTLAASGKTSEKYQNYVNFNKSMDLMKEQLVQFYSLSRMPEKAAEIKKLFNTIDFSTNPQQAYNSLMNLEKTYDVERQTFVNAMTNPEIYTKSSESTAVSLQKTINASPSMKDIAQKDLDNTAKKYGITVDQVKKRLGIK